MYPIIRLIKEMALPRNATPMQPLGVHVSYHRCWPQDMDMFMEMNNGRILTIFDLGRLILARRIGLMRSLRANGWGLTMAGVSVRYRKRIKAFTKFKMVTRAVGWDDRFTYLDQTIWVNDECAVQALYRAAVTDKNGIVAPQRVFDHFDTDMARPPLPDWVEQWITAEAARPWPPEMPEL